MVTTALNFIPVLLGTGSNVYGMARSFHEAYGVKSIAVGKARLSATSDNRIVTVGCGTQPGGGCRLCDTLIQFAGRYPGKTCCWYPAGTIISSSWRCAIRRPCAPTTTLDASMKSCLCA